MAFLRFLWRSIRRRPVLRLLLRTVLRLVRWFGWWRSAKLVFRQRRHGYAGAVALWRASLRLLRLGRAAWFLIGWIRRHGPRLFAHGKETLGFQVLAERRRLRAPGTASVLRIRTVRPNLTSRMARHRDELRRSVLSAMGVDPEWRPNRKRHGAHARATGRERHPRLGDGVSEPQRRTS